MKKILNFAMLCLLGFGVYTLFVDFQIIKKMECLGLGKSPVSSNDIGRRTDKPRTICAEPTIDANKDCYDSRECVGACILERYSEGYGNAGDFVTKNGRNTRGYCQPYEEMDCFVERDNGMIVMHKCPAE